MTLPLKTQRVELTTSKSFIFAKTNYPECRRLPLLAIMPDLQGHGDKDGLIDDLLRISPLKKSIRQPKDPT
jgi:hypothetical protein